MNCKAKVHDDFGVGFHRCTRKATKGGYCFQHHPDAVKKRREESERKYHERMERDPFTQLMRLQDRHKKLEAEVKRLRQWVAAQPCKFPQPVARLGNAVSDNVRDCGDCPPCQERRRALKGSKT